MTSEPLELARLARAVAAHARRARDRGQRSLPRPTEPTVVMQPTAPPAEASSQPQSTSSKSVTAASPKLPAARDATAQAARAAANAPVETVPTRSIAAAAQDLDGLRAAVAECTACGLCKTRKQTVFADGSPTARIMFVGEAPGQEEDASGVPFVGRAGQLLSDIITKGMGLNRATDVYIANVLKCRPPDNRDPSPVEKTLCTPFLERQIELVDPTVIVPLGRHASNHLLESDSSMGRLRGRVHQHNGRAVVPTYHPAYLLRSPSMKRATWEDIQLAMSELGLERPR